MYIKITRKKFWASLVTCKIVASRKGACNHIYSLFSAQTINTCQLLSSLQVHKKVVAHGTFVPWSDLLQSMHHKLQGQVFDSSLETKCDSGDENTRISNHCSPLKRIELPLIHSSLRSKKCVFMFNKKNSTLILHFIISTLFCFSCSFWRTPTWGQHKAYTWSRSLLIRPQ